MKYIIRILLIVHCPFFIVLAQMPSPVEGLQVHAMVRYPTISDTVRLDSVSTDTCQVSVDVSFRLIYPDSVQKAYVLFGSQQGQGDVLIQELPRGGTSEAPYLSYNGVHRPLKNRTDTEYTYSFILGDWKKVRYVTVYYRNIANAISQQVVFENIF